MDPFQYGAPLIVNVDIPFAGRPVLPGQSSGSGYGAAARFP